MSSKSINPIFLTKKENINCKVNQLSITQSKDKQIDMISIMHITQTNEVDEFDVNDVYLFCLYIPACFM